ncbi:peptide chain release factor-like protein [Penicillium daleae]|uniref:Peptide chain release factor-like protein n=1 Tax=Penicillium daleae TaxID=63821 RepID=A0AAD6BYT7_9EURO|nr:peptide chain release factor-like protein [Penicillium daleae]KAJ5438915.1 peptide chain release factor-like protein [Penicillium daleae]
MLRPHLWPRIHRGFSSPHTSYAPSTSLLSRRSFTKSPILLSKPLPARLKLNDADLTISYLKGTGPGGQKIVRSQRNLIYALQNTPKVTPLTNFQNKTNSAVQIIHGPSGIVVKCQATRSRSQNEKIARSLLADKVEAQEKGDQSRVALKAEAARKKKASKVKKARRKYRDLEKGAEEGEVVDGDGDGDFDANANVDARTTETGTSEKSPST